MAELLKIYPENPNPKAIQNVVDVLKKGGLIIYPTDTVYGLGCDITNVKALDRIAKIKGVKLERSNFSFICHDLSNLSDYVTQIETPIFKLLKRTLQDPIRLFFREQILCPILSRKRRLLEFVFLIIL